MEITGKEAVINEYKNEFEFRLRSRQPHEDWEEHTEEVNQVLRTWLSEGCESTPPFELEELISVIVKLKMGKMPGVDGYPAELFKRADEALLKSILKLFNIIKSRREIPAQWSAMQIVTIYKQKGDKKNLKYYRGIFLAMIISKIFEGLIKLRINESLNNVNILQAGSRKNRGGPDNVFLLRGTIDHHIFTKKPLYITAYDFEQAFDSLWVEDCMLALNDNPTSKLPSGRQF